MDGQYIFTMKGLTKTHMPDKTVFENITLSFMP